MRGIGSCISCASKAMIDPDAGFGPRGHGAILLENAGPLVLPAT